MRGLAVLLFALLAACGAEGPPEPVEDGLRIDGTAAIGVTAAF